MKPTSWIYLPIFFLFACSDAPAAEGDPATPATDTSAIVPIHPDTIPAAEPSQPDYDTTLWTDLAFLDSTLIIDMRYATEDNFVKEKMYPCSRCFLRPRVAEAVVAAHRKLREQGLGLKLLDCYRPRPVQQKLWDKFQDPRYVTPPQKGSMHNRGAAVDLTIVDVSGVELDMGTPYDYFGVEAHHAYTGLPKAVLNNRRLLKSLMTEVGLRPITSEWWHYSYPAGQFPLSEMVWNCGE